MAANRGLSPETTDNKSFPPDRSKDDRNVLPDNLMMRLRGRVNQYKSWNESIVALKMAVLNDKRYYSDALEKSSLQTCLDKLHRAMKIVNQQSFVERLELIARQLGMTFTPPTTAENHIVLSSEMFAVEIILDGSGGVKDVKIGHHENPVSCEELVEVLSKGDFDEFIAHMRGLLSIYSLNGDKKQKGKAYLALSSLEADLNVLAQLQSSISGVANYIHKSPLGILLPRKGGHPMKLIYFVSPYNLLCKKTKSSYPMTVEAITDNDLGHSVTVCLEPCTASNKLQTMPLISVKTHPQDGKSLPSFQGLNNMNSSSLPASFVLVLPHPVPVSLSIINAIEEMTGLDVCRGEEKSLHSLVLEQASGCKISNGTELFVTLPDQQHVYYLNNLWDSCLGQPGALITKIPFTHPTNVAKILNYLRQQLLFNSVIQSVVRPTASHDYKTSLVFELTAVSHQYLSVMFEHPLQDTMITVELDLADITSVRCRVCMANGDENICSDDFVSRAFQRCLSIPVTLRTVIQKVREEIHKLLPPEPVKAKHNKPKWKWRSESVNIPCLNVKSSVLLTTPPTQANVDSWVHGPHLEMRKYYLPFQPNMNSKFLEPPPPSEDHNEKPGANPLLATLLDQGSPASEHANTVSDSPMLSKLLEEQTPVTSVLTSNQPAAVAFTAPRRKQLGKRKSSKDVLSGKSPKHRPSETDIGLGMGERMVSERHGQGIAEKHLDLDSSAGSYEADPPVRPSSVSSVGSIGGQSSTGSVIDLTDIGESHVKKLENSLDHMLMKEARMGNVNLGMPMNMNNQMVGPEGMDFQMPPHMADLHHGQNQHMGDGNEFIHHSQWGSHPTPPRPTSRNSPHHGMVPKNETASTSLEGNLIGPGDGRDLQGPNQTSCRRDAGHQMRLANFRRQSSRTSVDSNFSGVISPDVFSPNTKSPGHHPLASPHHQMVSPGHCSTLTSPVHPPISSPSHILANMKMESNSSMYTPSTMTSPRNQCELKGGNFHVASYNISSSHAQSSTPSPVHYSSGKPSLSALKAQLEMKNDFVNSGCASSQEKDYFKTDERATPPGNIMKLRLNMKQYDNVSPPESDKSRSSMFDFHSDDEEFSLPHLEKSMTVVSASPTRLQISNKTKHTLKLNKSEKYKRKESKRSSAGDSSKRKRDKDESKKEKKRKKISNNSYSNINDNAVYKSTTVTVEGIGDNNFMPMPRLKITKSGVKYEAVPAVKVENVNSKVEDTLPIEIGSSSVICDNHSPVPQVENMSSKLESSSKAIKLENVSPEETKNETGTANIEVSSSKKHETITVKDDRVTEKVFSKDSKELEIKLEKLEAKSSVTHVNTVNHDSERRTEKNETSLVKVESSPGESKSGEIIDKIGNKDTKDKVSEKGEQTRTSSVSNEGIFDKIAAMKNDNLSKSEITIDSQKDGTNSKKMSSKSQKAHKAQRSSSHSKDDNVKIAGRTPTLKLKPVTFPSPTSSAQSCTSNSPVPKSISASPTSTTIGKIGAVSLATSGSQKHLTPSNKSPQGSHKLSSTKGSSGAILSKSTGNLQKTVQITGSVSGKNSPVPRLNKSGSLSSNKSVSLSSLSSKSAEKAARMLSTSNKTSSPVSGREKESSKSRSSSTSRDRDRDRDKSTSSSKTSVPVTTVLTQETAASVLSFLNPKASSIAKLPPIPKKLNSGDSAKNSPTTSSVTTTTSAASSSIMSSSNVSHNNANSRSTSLASGLNSKVKNVSAKPNNLNRQISNTVNNSINRTGNNSPVNYSNKNHSNSYSNKNNNSNSTNMRTSNVNNSNTNFSRGNSASNHAANSAGNRGNNPALTNRTNSAVSNSNKAFTPPNRGSANVPSNPVANRSTITGTTTASVSGGRNSVSLPNAPRGPGPPSSNTSSVNSNEHSKTKPSSQQSRGRKGSLSAVIDKLTCKVSVSDIRKVNDVKAGKVVIDESPASPEPETGNSDKLGKKTNKPKVVINESPESPEPDVTHVTAHQSQRPKSQGNIVSIPLDKQVSRSPESSKQSDRVIDKKHGNSVRDKSKSNRPVNLTISKSPNLNSKISPSPTSSVKTPISIPLTPKSKEPESPVRNKPSKILKKQDSTDNVSYSGDTNGEFLEDEDLRIILNQKPPQGYRNTPGIPITNKSGNSTPLDFSARKPSPVIVSDKTDKIKENLFIPPTSRSASVDRDNEDLENHYWRRKSRSNSKPISSPESPCSSPDNGLIIDCPSSPKHLVNKTNSPLCNQDGLKKDIRTSPNFLKSVKSSPLSKIRPSPGTSPGIKDHGSNASSPCFIDDEDDLMDVALIGDGSNS